MSSKSRVADLKKGTNTSSQPPQWTEFLCCSVCEKDFDRTDRCPISLGCGHTLCRACLLKLKQPQCHFDQTPITCNIIDLPANSALLQLLPGDADKSTSLSCTPGNSHDPGNISQYLKNYENARASIEELALYLKPGKSSNLSRPMQRKLVALINCQLFEDEGRKRALRASRALGERTATELILLHQNPTTLSASLWAAVRARGCQFLGPAMQEEALKLIHLALEDGSELSRKVLVQIVVKNLQTQFSQASKTSIGHVVQLLYRASCFKVTKRDGDSSLMRLKEEFLLYEDLRKEHDTQIVQIAREAGLRIAPDQWSALLYGDQVHKSHMQSIIDRLQSGVSFSQCITDLNLALQRSNDPGNIQGLFMHFKYLSDLNTENPLWDALEKSTYSVKFCVKELTEFTKHHHHWLWQCQDATQQTSKYKTSMCRDSKNKGICPRGQSCTFAHSEAELQHYRNRRKKGGQVSFNAGEFRTDGSNSGDSSIVTNKENEEIVRAPTGIVNVPHQGHICPCGNTINQAYAKGSIFVHDHMHSPNVAPHLNQQLPPPAVINQPQILPNVNTSLPMGIRQQGTPMVASPGMTQQPSQVHYVAGNQVLYETKPAGYEPVHFVPPNTHSQYTPSMPVATIEIQSAGSKPMHGVVPPNQYLVHRQQSPSYCQVQPNQVQAVVPEPVLTPPHPGSFPVQHSPYASLVLQNGQQMAVPAPARPELMQQAPVVYQQPSVPLQNLPPSQPLNYPSPVLVQTPTAQQPAPNMISHPALPAKPSAVHNKNIVAPAMLSSVVLSPEELPAIPKPNYDQYHVVVPPSIDSSASLAELRHRKDEVINKLVKKRIVAPKVEDNLQEKVSYFCDLPLEESCNNGSGDKLLPQKSEYFPVSFHTVAHNSGGVPPTAPLSYASESPPGKIIDQTSDGHYNLWAGTTCITSLSEFSFLEEMQDQSLLGIDVVADLDTSTAQVSSFQDDSSYIAKYSQAHFAHLANELASSSSCSTEDEIVSIQDQRIVSKYGPIARTVRSKTTSAIPEQVTANANGATHSFLSDKNRNKSNFVAVEQNATTQSLMCVRSEVEPTAVSVSSRKLPDLVCNHYTYSSMPTSSIYTQDTPQVVISNEVNEDLLLAMELQQIEIGIQRIQRDSKSK